jgi:hypothetical protein
MQVRIALKTAPDAKGSSQRRYDSSLGPEPFIEFLTRFVGKALLRRNLAVLSRLRQVQR